MTAEPLLARKLGRTANPYAAIVFLAPEAAEAYAAVGPCEGRMGYFAGRAAPMGAVPAEVVVAAGYSGCDAMVMTQAMDHAPAAFVATRAWSPEQWAAAADSPRARGLIGADGAATEAGRAHREVVEHQTDLLSVGPLEALGEPGCMRLRELLRPMSVTIARDLFPAATSPGLSGTRSTA